MLKLKNIVSRFSIGLGVAFGMMLVLTLSVFFLRYNFTTLVERIPGAIPPLPEGEMMCTMEAKQCADGSYVGRSGPNCEFAPCSEMVQ